MKAGDKIYCTKNIIKYKKGGIYELECDSTPFDIIVKSPSENNSGILFDTGYFSVKQFKEHFISLKELRKLKLERINK